MDETDKEVDDKSPEMEEEEPGDIVYHYLTFATTLPQPTLVPKKDGQLPAPEAPNLRKYDSPFEWPETRKNLIIYLSCFITALASFAASSYSPGVDQMTEEWHVSRVAAYVGITMFTCGKHPPFHGVWKSRLGQPR